jgi:hypothetical protein
MTLTTSEHDFTFFLKNTIGEKYSKICLKSIYIQHEIDANKLFIFGNPVVIKPLSVHCSMLNRDDNIVNDTKSDVIAVFYPEPKPQKYMHVKFGNQSHKLLIHNNYMRMLLTCFENEPIENTGKCLIFYELEFS